MNAVVALTVALESTSTMSIVGLVILQCFIGKVIKKILAYFYTA